VGSIPTIPTTKRSVGRPRVGPDAYDLHVLLPAALTDTLSRIALRRKVPLTAVVREALNEYVESRTP
jgi:hypothetical protein